MASNDAHGKQFYFDERASGRARVKGMPIRWRFFSLAAIIGSGEGDILITERRKGERKELGGEKEKRKEEKGHSARKWHPAMYVGHDEQAATREAGRPRRHLGARASVPVQPRRQTRFTLTLTNTGSDRFMPQS